MIQVKEKGAWSEAAPWREVGRCWVYFQGRATESSDEGEEEGREGWLPACSPEQLDRWKCH